MALDETVHIFEAALAVASLIGFAQAIVHARDDVDRLYLVGGALLLTAVVGGSIAILHQPLTYRTWLVIAAMVVWIASAYKSRRRRRLREAARRGGPEAT